MARRFIISTANLNKSNEEKVRKYFESMDAAWWHWLPNTWLIVTTREMESIEITQELGDKIRNVNFMVMNVSGSGNFTGRFSEPDVGKITNWIGKHWIDRFSHG